MAGRAGSEDKETVCCRDAGVYARAPRLCIVRLSPTPRALVLTQMLEAMLLAVMRTCTAMDAAQDGAGATEFCDAVMRHFAIALALEAHEPKAPTPPSSRTLRFDVLDGVPANVMRLKALSPHAIYNAFQQARGGGGGGGGGGAPCSGGNSCTLSAHSADESAPVVSPRRASNQRHAALGAASCSACPCSCRAAQP